MNRLSFPEILEKLEIWLEVEFSMKDVGGIAKEIAMLSAEDQDFLLGWIRKLSCAQVQLASLFAQESPGLLSTMDKDLIDSWAMKSLDALDREGLHAAVAVLRGDGRFLDPELAEGVFLEEVKGVLLTFAHGLSGKRLKIEKSIDSIAWTDGETLHLPDLTSVMEKHEDNFELCKARVAMLWAQTNFGTARMLRENKPTDERALQCLWRLESLRLESCIAGELPGLWRKMEKFRKGLPGPWRKFEEALVRKEAEDSLSLLNEALSTEIPEPPPWHCELRMAEIEARMEKEKARFRSKLSEIKGEGREFSAKKSEETGEIELFLDRMPVKPPDGVKSLLNSVWIDFGEIPPEYLVPSGEGEYEPGIESKDPEEVWSGTYHEEGAIFYPEWDFGSGRYKKNWCVVREREAPQGEGDFATDTLSKYPELVKRVRRTFEGMRDQERLLKRQKSGEHVDLDALIDAIADSMRGGELSELLYASMHRSERSIAAAFLVDMSGSTKGWVNDAEREALVIMCEALESLGDRYAIYGFSGMTRKKCEMFRIKGFEENYGETVKARISGISPRDYTRMGFAIRHISRLLADVDAKRRLLFTLSDGRPEDYNDNYRGEYGILDTRQALIEARRAGIHPFCITMDREGKEYLPRLYGPARYAVLSEVGALPLKVAEIYRRLTRF